MGLLENGCELGLLKEGGDSGNSKRKVGTLSEAWEQVGNGRLENLSGYGFEGV